MSWYGTSKLENCGKCDMLEKVCLGRTEGWIPIGVGICVRVKTNTRLGLLHIYIYIYICFSL